MEMRGRPPIFALGSHVGPPISPLRIEKPAAAGRSAGPAAGRTEAAASLGGKFATISTATAAAAAPAAPAAAHHPAAAAAPPAAAPPAAHPTAEAPSPCADTTAVVSAAAVVIPGQEPVDFEDAFMQHLTRGVLGTMSLGDFATLLNMRKQGLLSPDEVEACDKAANIFRQHMS